MMFEIAVLNAIATACENRGIDIGTVRVEDIGAILFEYLKL